MIDTAALKNRILALAMNGQVANNKKEVKLLFDCLCENAYKMDKNKVSDKNYDLSELPFEIPDNWKWVWLGDIFQHNTGKALNSSNTEGTYLEYITTSNLYWDRFELEELKTMLFKDSEIEKCTVRKGDLLICEGGDIGRSAIWSEDYEMRIQNHIHRLRPYVEDICVRFYYYVMMYYKNNGLISGRGIGLQGLSSKRLHSILVPLPDVETQLLIAEKIDESFSVIDAIDELQQQYSSDLEVLKSKIIDAGIQGKLTEQLPEDGTAEELSKNHIDDIINQEEKILDIPSNWSWIKLGWAMEIERGGSPRPIKAFVTDADDGINWIKIGDVAKDGKYIYQTKEKIKPEGEQKSRKVYPGDFLLTNSMSFGRPYISKIEGCIHDGWLLLRNTNELFDLDYLYWLLSSGYAFKQFSKKAAGATVDNLNKDKVASAVIPLPPLSEQKRIANVLEEIMNKL